MITGEEVPGAGDLPLVADAAFPSQPEPSLFYSDYTSAPGASYIAAGTSPPSSSLLPDFPSSAPSTVPSYLESGSSSSSSLQQQQQQLFYSSEQLPQHYATLDLSSSFLADAGGLQNGSEEDLFAVVAGSTRPQPAPSVPFQQLELPSPEQPQTPTQLPTQTYPNQAMAAAPAPVVDAVPLAVVPPAKVPADDPALPDTPPLKDQTRRRGRPRKDAVAAASGPNRPAAGAASRRKASRQPRLQAAQQPSTSAVQKAPCAWEEALMAEEERTEPYSDTTAPGVRFQPNNEEIIGYLRLKYVGRKLPVDFIRDFNIYEAHPEKVTELCGESVDGCWYVFSPRKRRYRNGVRPARAVRGVGFWKSNTKEEGILRAGDDKDGTVIGKVTALTFTIGHQPKGTQTAWKMKEYCIPEKQHEVDGTNMLLDDWVLCKIFCNGDEQGEQMGLVDEDADEAEADEDIQSNGTAGTEESAVKMDEVVVQSEPVDWLGQPLSNNYEEDLSVDDYLVFDDPVFGDQNQAAF